MKSLKKTVLFLFLFVCFDLYSQTDDYLPGYVITQTGDSIAGKILYRGNNSYNDVCFFKEEGTNEDKQFTPKDIKLYRYFDSKCYVPMDISTGKKIHTVFVEYLLNGIVSIYYYGYLKKYYLKSETGEIIPIVGVEEVPTRGNYIFHYKKYIGILKYVFKNDNKTLERLDKKNVTLDQRTLISLGRGYHSSICNEWECVVYEKDYNLVKKQERDIRFKNMSIGFWGGVNYGFIPLKKKHIAAEERHIASIEKNNCKNSFNPYLGIFINYRLFFIHPNLDFKYELDYSGQTNKRAIKYTSVREEYRDRIYDIEIVLRKKIISNTFYLKYNFIKTSDNNLYIQGGYSLMYLPHNTFQRQGKYNFMGITDLNINLSTPEIKLKKIMQGSKLVENFQLNNGLSFGIGYQRIYKKIKLNGEIKYKAIWGNTVENKRNIKNDNYNPVPFIGHNLALTVGVELPLLSK